MQDQEMAPTLLDNQGISGLYTWQQGDLRQELRIDVDGRYPQHVVSGTLFRNLAFKTHWIANVSLTGTDIWEGVVSRRYRDRNETDTFPYTNVRIQVTRSPFPNQRKAVVEFSAGGMVDQALTYRFESQYFHKVAFEFDVLEGHEAVTSYDTHSHPDKPPSMPRETLTVQEVFGRSGIDMQMTQRGNIVRDDSGADEVFAVNELHDVMQQNFSLYKETPAWEGWTFFASRFKDEPGQVVFGIMFDYEEGPQRQGCAIFNDAFPLANRPDPTNPEAAMRREKFFTACHEIGHMFNLYHSWIKSYPTPWIGLGDKPQARSFMNYPGRAQARSEFYKSFEFRFDDPELLYMRHAPEPFVKMGANAFGNQHAFELPQDSTPSGFRLELRVNKEQPLFKFMEPVVVELKLTNTSNRPQLVSPDILSDFDQVTVMVQKDGGSVELLHPFARYCREHRTQVLMPDESLYESRFISVGLRGWCISNPGIYTVRAVLRMNGQTTILSNPLRLRVAPPRSYEEEFLAQDLFTEEVGRVLAFDGSRFLHKGNDTLRELVERFPDHEGAIHARIALAKSAAIPYKLLDLEQMREGNKKLRVLPVLEQEAEEYFSAALTQQQQTAADTLCHIDYKFYMESYTEFLTQQGNTSAAKETQTELYNTLSKRGVHPRVLQEIKNDVTS